MINTIFGLRIEEIRKNKGLKQKDLANILNLSRSTISSYEKGSRMASIDFLVKTSIIFNVDINYLIGTECISKRNGMIVNISYQEYEIIKELRKFNKLYKLFIKYPSRIIKRINNIFF